MKKSFIVSWIAFLLMIGCRTAYSLSPNYVAEDGLLVESFAYIPLGWLCAFVLIISLIVGIVLYIRRKK